MTAENDKEKHAEIQDLLSRLIGNLTSKGLKNPSGSTVTAEVWPCHTGSGSHSGCAAAANCSGGMGAGVYNYAFGYLLRTGGSSSCPDTLRVTDSQKDIFDVIEAYDPGRLYYICCDDIQVEGEFAIADLALDDKESALLKSVLEKLVVQSKTSGGCGCGGDSKEGLAKDPAAAAVGPDPGRRKE